MALEMNARRVGADVAVDAVEPRDGLALVRATPGEEVRELREMLQVLMTAHTAQEERFASLETAAQLAIAAVADAAEIRLAQVVDRGETRVMDALSLIEQQQRDVTQWRDAMQTRIDEQVRNLGEWDDELHEVKQELSGMREMAEAALGVASDELDRRWENIRRELTDILETGASDERARWEAFMHSANESLANSAGIDPAEVDALRIDIAALREAASASIASSQQAQREQLAILRTEMRTLMESERVQILTTLNQRVDEAQNLVTTQREKLIEWQDGVAVRLHEWQDGVSAQVSELHETARQAEHHLRQNLATIRGEAQSMLDQLHQEVDLVIAQARGAARTEISGVRAETERSMTRLHRQSRTWQVLTLIIAVLAFLASGAAVALPFFHLP